MTVELNFEESFTEVKNSLDKLREEKPSGWQEAAIDLILNSPAKGSDLEYLKRLNIIDLTTEMKIGEAISRLQMGGTKERDLKVMVAKALGIQKVYQETHHVFIHSQMSSWILYPALVKELMQVHEPTKDFKGFEFLRMPTTIKPYDIKHYSESTYVHDHDPMTRENLISADAYFYNTQTCESALYFLATNSNIMAPSPEFIERTIHSFYKDFNPLKLKSMAKRVLEVKKEDNSKLGNLFVISIPKGKSDEIQYRAHPFGPSCNCHEKQKNLEVLEKLQNGVLDCETKCHSYYSIPQYRIFTPEMSPENGVKIHLIPSNVPFLEKVRDKVKTVVQHMELFKPPANSSFEAYRVV